MALPMVSLLSVASAHAQTPSTQTPPVNDSAASAGTGTTGPEEIVVTAERRSAVAKNVPITMTVVSASMLQDQGIVDINGLGQITPSFVTITQEGYGAPRLRGIGSTNTTAGDEPSVATYIDGFYQGLSVDADLPFNNIQRIEVLKGPQGTLYGRNAVGGLVNIITRNPTDEATFEGAFGYGNYNTVKGQAYIAGGLMPNVDASLAITGQNQADGFARNIVNGQYYGSKDYFGARSKVLIDFGGDNSLLISGYYSYANNDMLSILRPATGTTPLITGPGIVYATKPFDFAMNFNPAFEVEEEGINATLKLDLGFADFVSLTQDRRTRIQLANSGDGIGGRDGIASATQLGVAPGLPHGGALTPQLVSPGSLAPVTLLQHSPYFVTQENQLLSKGDGPLTWIVGTYFQSSKDAYGDIKLFDSVSGPPLVKFDTFETTLAFAGYAQATYAFDNGFSLTGGLRYSAERKHMGGPLSVINASGAYDQFEAPQTAWFHSLTYKTSLEYRFNPELMMYATVSTGFKSGLFNTEAIGAPVVQPEHIFAYEVGIKSNPISWLRLDASTYYYVYKDLQTFGDSPQGTSTLENVGGAHMAGGELSAEVVPFSGLTLRAAIGVEDARYTNSPGVAGYYPSPSGASYPVTENVIGRHVQETPDLTGNIGASYDFPLQDLGTITLTVNVAYTGRFYWDPVNVYSQDGYALVDLTAGYTFDDGRYNVTLWGKNITDQRYYSYLLPGQRFDGAQDADPATFGVTFSAKY
jgi:iron complex outermembrane receptor protein